MVFLKRFALIVIIFITVIWFATLFKLNFIPDKHTQLSNNQLLQAEEYLVNQLSSIPNEFRFSMFRTSAGIDLRTGILEHPRPKGTVIVVPGFTGTIEMSMREIVLIHSQGYRVAIVEYRGQGLSYRPLPAYPERGYVESYAVLGAELGEFAKHVMHKDSPLFFFSISKGAHITMRMAAEQDIPVNAFVLVVPMVHINTGDIPYSFSVRLAKLMTYMGLGAVYTPGASTWPNSELVFGYADHCNSNPRTAQTQDALFASNKNLRTRGVTFKWLHETAKSSAELLNPQFIAPILAPVKVFTAGIDTLVLTEKTTQFCDLLADCVSQHYANARHCITREDYTLYDSIVRDAVSHFDANLQSD